MKKKIFVVTICLLLASCVGILPVHATTTWANYNFENYSTGWTTGQGNTGYSQKTGAYWHSGSYSALFSSTASTAYAYAYNNTATISVNFHYSIWIYVPSGITQYGILVAEPYDGSTVSWQLAVWSNSTGYYLSEGLFPSTYSNVTLISQNTWVHIEAYYIRASGILHIYVDNTKIGGDWTTGVAANKSPNTFYLGDVSGAGTDYNGKLYCDDLLIDDAAEPSGGVEYSYTVTSSVGINGFNKFGVDRNFLVGGALAILSSFSQEIEREFSLFGLSSILSFSLLGVEKSFISYDLMLITSNEFNFLGREVGYIASDLVSVVGKCVIGIEIAGINFASTVIGIIQLSGTPRVIVEIVLPTITSPAVTYVAFLAIAIVLGVCVLVYTDDERGKR